MARGDIGQSGTQSPGPGSDLKDNLPKGLLKPALVSLGDGVCPWLRPFGPH